jgi:hypothetical protein
MATPFTVRNRISRRIGRPSSSVIKFKRIIKISKSQLNWLAVASSHHPQPGEHRNPYLNVLLCLEAKGCLRTLSHTRSFTVTSTVVRPHRAEPGAGWRTNRPAHIHVTTTPRAMFSVGFLPAGAPILQPRFRAARSLPAAPPTRISPLVGAYLPADHTIQLPPSSEAFHPSCKSDDACDA